MRVRKGQVNGAGSRILLGVTHDTLRRQLKAGTHSLMHANHTHTPREHASVRIGSQ